jgi:hypothetical protein
MATSSNDKLLGAYFIGLPIPGKLGCTNRKTNKMTYYYYEGTKKAALMGNEYQMPEGVDKNFFHLI